VSCDTTPGAVIEALPAAQQIPITYYSDGYRLAADLYLPCNHRADQLHPAIILCHGFGGLRKFWLPEFARFFAAGGYAVLAFDHRGTGESEGPVLSLNPLGQVADIRNGITYLTTRPEIDKRAIGLYGISFGGANAVYAAATDHRVAAVICAVGYGDGSRWLRSLRREWEWIEFRQQVEADRAQRVLTGKGALVDTSDVLIRDPEAAEHEAEARHRDPKRVTHVTLETADAIMSFKPEALVADIAPRPSFFIGVEDDTLVSTEETRQLFAKAGQPKKLYLFGPIGHHAIYYGDELPQLLGMCRTLFDENIGRSKGVAP
jgi:pimeloyl-ACP methyl ester carboxylesterase